MQNIFLFPALLCLTLFSQLHAQTTVNPLVHNGVVVALSANSQKPIFIPFMVVDQAPGICAFYSHQNNNPQSIIRYFNCSELGTNPISVWTSAPGSLRNVETQTYALVQDNIDICPQFPGYDMPIILCRNGLAVGVNGTGYTFLQPSDFDLSTVVCNNDPGIKLSFSADTTNTSLYVDCQTPGINLVQIWATGSNGIQNFAEVYYNLQDNLNACGAGADTLAPHPRATSGAAMSVDYGGNAVLYAASMDAGSLPADTLCTPLHFSFSQDTNDISRTYTCNDLGVQSIELWVTDACGRQNFVSTFVSIQNNGDCADASGITNDNQPNAVELTTNDSCEVYWSNVGASVENGEIQPATGNCSAPGVWCDSLGAEHTVWFKFVAPLSGSAVLESGGLNTQLAVWEEVPAVGWVLVDANDDTPGTTDGRSSLTLACLEAGKTYWVQVDGHSGVEGQFSIQISDPQIACLISGTGENALACGEKQVIPVLSNGNGTWQYLIDADGAKVAAINDQGNVLGQVSAEYMIHGGPDVRTDAAGNPYLDRNWTINVEIQPALPVLIRLFVPTAEYQRLAAAPGGPNQPADVNLTKISDTDCGDYPGGGTWIWNDDVQFLNDTDLAYTFSIDGFSAFYLHGGEALTRTTSPQLLDAGLYPVPTFGAVYLRGLPTGEFQVSVSDLTGRSMSGFNYLNDGSPVALPVLPVGQYVLRATDGKKIWSGKLIIAE